MRGSEAQRGANRLAFKRTQVNIWWLQFKKYILWKKNKRKHKGSDCREEETEEQGAGEEGGEDLFVQAAQIALF